MAVIAGQGGRAFSVGGDLKRVAEGMDTASNSHRPVPQFGRMHPYDDIANCAKPVIAAIDGYCLAGGLEIALMCDIRVATESSSFGLPEPRRGMMPGPGLHHLSRMIPLGEALRLQLTGGRMNASRAYQIGLVQEIASDREELFEKVQEMSDEIAQCAPMAVQGIKKVVRRGRDLPVEQSWLLAGPGPGKAGEVTGGPRRHNRVHAEARSALAPRGARLTRVNIRLRSWRRMGNISPTHSRNIC